ncbi:unnamed protein product [Pleuronectes platessa]|uniref:Immunoglobulin V-set domain-containing protein n=1 Tax=Pleuronectes platessa TaxID=8262 RepID=A0A9N7Z3V5_PLEPL|nr:unnamed protein product [Pleuronectes platessa]
MKDDKMITLFFMTFNIVLVSGSSLSDKVQQLPAHIYKKPTETAKIYCSHSIDSYNVILWYKQINNRELQLLGYMRDFKLYIGFRFLFQ